MNNKIAITVSVFLALACSACAKKTAIESQVLAKVGNKLVTVGDFKKKLDKLPPYYQSVVSKNKKRYLDEMALEMLLYEDAVRTGVDKAQDIKDLMAEARKKIIIAKYIKNRVEDKVDVSDAEMKGFYEANKDKFRSPEMWRASHILVADEIQARQIQSELSRGGSFEQLAKERSTDATASRGGDIGYFRAGTLVPDFENACMKLEVGQTSDIVETQFGYHIIKLTDKKDPQPMEFDEVKDAIKTELTRAKRGEAFDLMVKDLKDRYGVEMREDTLLALEASEGSPAGPAEPPKDAGLSQVDS